MKTSLKTLSFSIDFNFVVTVLLRFRGKQAVKNQGSVLNRNFFCTEGFM